MNASKLSLGIVLGGFLGLSPAVQAAEWRTASSGAELIWMSSEISFEVVFDLENRKGRAFSAAARTAAHTWADAVPGRFFINYLGPASQISPSDSKNTIAALNPWNTTFGDVEGTVAHAVLVYDTQSGEITEADLLLNTETFRFTHQWGRGFDSESVILHEMGHLLGFAHSCGDGRGSFPSCFSVPAMDQERILEAVMAPTLSVRTERRMLGPDDLEGLRQRYTSTSTAIVVSNLVRECPSGRLKIDVAGLDDTAWSLHQRRANGDYLTLQAQLSSGRVELLEALSATASDSLDIVLQQGMRQGALIGVEVPDECKKPPTPPALEDDCNCSSTQSRSGAPWTALLLLLALGLRFRRGLALLAFGLVFTLSQSAFAYRCTRAQISVGPSLTWAHRTIPWYAGEGTRRALASSMQLTEQTLEDAFLAWQGAPCSDLNFEFRGIQEVLRASYIEGGKNQNVVSFHHEIWPYESGTIALTTSTFDTITGDIKDSDIELNAKEFDFIQVDDSCAREQGHMDLQNTLTHEIGHLIGLDHPENTPEFADTTMFARAPACEVKKRTLDADDRLAICTIYPAGEANNPCFPAERPGYIVVDKRNDQGGGCRHQQGRTHSFQWMLLGAAFLLLALRRR